MTTIVQDLRQQLDRVLTAYAGLDSVVFDLSVPTSAGHGDYATNVALVVSKSMKQSPLTVANEIVGILLHDDWFSERFERIEAVKPGFINFFLSTKYVWSLLPTFVASLGKPLDTLNEKIVIEHTNVNPNKAMHIGHLRNSILGDTIARVLQRAGYTTEVQYYVDDTGVQVADSFLGLSTIPIQQEVNEKFDHFMWRVYSSMQAAYDKDASLLEKRVALLHTIEAQDSDMAQQVKSFAKRIVCDHLSSMQAFGITYNLLVWESDVLAAGFWSSAFDILKKNQAFILEKEGKNVGCWVLKVDEKETDEHSPHKVLVKSDKTVTYTGKDIAYHLWKFDLLGKDFTYGTWSNASQEKPLATTDTKGMPSGEFGHADRVYNVIDSRQAYPQAMVKHALETLGYVDQAANLRHISYGVVSLSPETTRELGMTTDDDKTAYSMSGRKGIGIKVDDLLASVENHVESQTYEVASTATHRVSTRDIAVGAIKYFMLRYNPLTDIVFDMKEALTLQGNTGPYLQYAHARASSILGKADAPEGHTTDAILDPHERALLAKLYQWPTVLTEVVDFLNVNAITVYAYELAETFNRFYEHVPVLKASAQLRDQRLTLVAAYQSTIADVLSVLGIVAPDNM